MSFGKELISENRMIQFSKCYYISNLTVHCKGGNRTRSRFYTFPLFFRLQFLSNSNKRNSVVEQIFTENFSREQFAGGTYFCDLGK